MHSYNHVFNELERPFAWLDYDALDHNIAFVKTACGDKKIRLATKSIRSVEMLRYIQNKLPNVSGLMTFTGEETNYLIERGFDHFLIGYPIMEEQSILTLLQFVDAGFDITFMVDHIDQVKLIQRLAASLDVIAQVCIDINLSVDFKFIYFGTKRSPLNGYEEIAPLLHYILAQSHIKIYGVMGYEAQIAGVADSSSRTTSRMGNLQQTIKGNVIRQLKNRSYSQIEHTRKEAFKLISTLANPTIINGGGSGSMQYTANQNVTEITVGSAFYAPALFDGYDALELQPAIGFALSVTRKFSDDIVVCHGGGYIASGAPNADRLPQLLIQHQFEYLSLEGAGEVQTPIKVKQGTVNIGDTIYFRHAKAGELCERFETLHSVRGNEYLGPIKTYRGDGQCFL